MRSAKELGGYVLGVSSMISGAFVGLIDAAANAASMVADSANLSALHKDISLLVNDEKVSWGFIVAGLALAAGQAGFNAIARRRANNYRNL